MSPKIVMGAMLKSMSVVWSIAATPEPMQGEIKTLSAGSAIDIVGHGRSFGGGMLASAFVL